MGRSDNGVGNYKLVTLGDLLSNTLTGGKMSDENKAAELEAYLNAIDEAAFREHVERELSEDIDSHLEEWHTNALLYGVSFLMLNSNGEIRVLKPEEYECVTGEEFLLAKPIDNP